MFSRADLDTMLLGAARREMQPARGPITGRQRVVEAAKLSDAHFVSQRAAAWRSETTHFKVRFRCGPVNDGGGDSDFESQDMGRRVGACAKLISSG